MQVPVQARRFGKATGDWSVCGSGVDAITLTFPEIVVEGHNTFATHRLIGWYKDVRLGASDEYKVSANSRLGFHGASIESMFTGTKDGRRIVAITGAGAEDWFKREQPYAPHCSRIDFQTTFVCDRDIDTIIGDMAEAALKYREGLNGKPFHVKHLRGFGGGDTLMLGSRHSDMYIRIYNKYKESGENEADKNKLRIEVELKGGYANRAYDRASVAPILQLYAGEVVEAASAMRGVGVSPTYHSEVAEALRQAPTPSDVATKLNWLSGQVAPSVRWLLTKVDRGSILAALGFDGEV